jgi:ceramide synthetase
LYSVHTSFSFALGLFHVLKQGWLGALAIDGEPEALVAGYPQSAASMGFKHFYLFELGFWLSCCLFLAFETRRKDFGEMVVHHASTVVLVTFSYLLDFCRPGILIMVLHDAGDVFLYSAKAAQYRGLRRVADMLFVAFAVTFFVTRLFLLPVALFFPLALAIWRGETSEGMTSILHHGQGTRLSVLTSIFGVLICLHAMWGYIIAKMVARTLRSTSKSVADSGDPRSDDESASAEPVKGPQAARAD